MSSTFDAGVFGALASQHRLLVIEWLKDPWAHFPPQCRGQPGGGWRLRAFIADKLGVAQPNTTTHLQALARAGLVTSRRVGQWTYYKSDEPAIAALKQKIEEGL